MTVIATAGHVDHGKSSLVRAICGTDPDRLAEEKRRGMTIELGFAHRVLGDGTVLSFVDVPGHTDFVTTMVSGVSAAGVALLVVDAGEGWMPQTEEHVAILGLLGVREGVVAVSKSDRVDAGTLASVVSDARGRLATGPVRWHDIIAVSVVDGSGIDDLVGALARAVGRAEPQPQSLRRTRVFIDRVFTIRGQGTVVTGTVDSGTVRPGDTLEISRTGAEIRVRSVQTHGSDVPEGVTRSRCALGIPSAEVGSLRRGDALVSPDGWFMTEVFDAEFHVLRGSRAVRRREGFSLHVGTRDVAAGVRVIGGDTIEPGTNGAVRVRCAARLPLTPGDRFVLRDPGTGSTVGGGTVLDVDPRERITRAAPDGSVGSQMRGRGWVPVTDARRITGRALVPVAGNWFATTEVVESTRAELRARVEDGSLDVAVLGPAERALLGTMGVGISHGRTTGSSEGLENHPVALAVRAAGTTPPPSTGLDRDTVRRMVHAGILFEHDGIAFHRDVLLSLHGTLARLWAVHPGGFTLSQLREGLGITRKHAVPLAECLDRLGLTTRRGDVRVPGPVRDGDGGGGRESNPPDGDRPSRLF